MRRYLVVDDSRTVRLSVVGALRAAGVAGDEIDEAENEGEARAAAATNAPHVIFLDMMLGDKNCLAFMTEILAERPSTRVVLTTGLDREHPDVVRAISDGAFGYLRKPVRLDAVRGILSEIDVEDGRGQRIR